MIKGASITWMTKVNEYERIHVGFMDDWHNTET